MKLPSPHGKESIKIIKNIAIHVQDKKRTLTPYTLKKLRASKNFSKIQNILTTGYNTLTY